MASAAVGQEYFWKTLLVSSLLLNLIIINPLINNNQNTQLFFSRWTSVSPASSRTTLTHIAFGLMGSVPTWPQRRGYLEAWWRPNKTRGYVFLDRPPPPELLPWPDTAPPYRVVDNLTELFRDTKPRFELMPRMVHGILELFREEHEDVRWVVMGDDDSIFFVDNIVDVLAEYDHRKYYYLGWHSESVISNYWFSFQQAFGGGGIVLSYPLARALVKDMEGCLLRYAQSTSADLITMTCIADIGVNLTPHPGIHQVDLRGDFSGYLSAHPKVHVMTFHHFDAMDPIFPSMDRIQSTRHLMTAGDADQSRLLQQTICYHKQSQWSFSVAWGYSAQIYERVMPRSYLQMPIETFTPWARGPDPPFYMFNTRPKSHHPCEAPHLFFLESVSNTSSTDHELFIVTSYSRAAPRALPPCFNHSADSVTHIRVFSPAHKRLQVDLRGDFSGYLSAHPKVHVMTFHHFDAMDPIFPSMDRIQSTRHLMTAGDADQSRLLQQTICYHKQSQWSFSVAWGYSAQIYERVMPRSYLQMPIETFTPWARGPDPPFYMFNTRPKSHHPCEAPHLFFLESVSNTSSTDHELFIVTSYSRAAPRALPPCFNHSADSVTHIRVFSPAHKRLQIDRTECCDVVEVDGVKADIRFRECMIHEIIA